MEPTTHRRLGGTLLAAAALATTAGACGDDRASADHAFCDAALAAEAAAMSEDPAAIETAFTAAAEAAPDDIRPAVETVIAESMAGNHGSPEFAAAYSELTDWVASECGFATLTITATDHTFAGFPDALEAGPVVVALNNDGDEFHQLTLMRIADDRATILDDPASLSEDEIFAAATPVGGAFAAPGTTATGMAVLQPGSYLAICFLPIGATPENMAAIEAGDHGGGDPHYTAGMVQRFTVT